MDTIEKKIILDEVLQKKPWNLSDSFQYCERLAKKHYENFPVGSLLIPKKIRPYVWALYAFARRADDFADEEMAEQDRLPSLDAWQDLLEQSQKVRVNHPVFLAVRETQRKFQIPTQLLTDLIKAFKMDVTIKRHPTFKHLLYYCRHSANPVGRMVLYLFGYQEKELLQLSDLICTALQLANFWQDIAIDLEKNRIYIPQEDLQHFQYSEEDLFNKKYNENFQKLMAFQVNRTDQLFREGAPLTEKVSFRLGLELKCVVLGGMGILEKIKNLQYNTLEQRPVISSGDKGKILGKALFSFRKHTRKRLVPAIQKPIPGASS